MKLNNEHLMVMEAMGKFPFAADVLSIMKRVIHPNAPKGAANYFTERRIFSLLDHLETEGLAQRMRLWPSAGGIIVWSLTKKGVECLTKAHY
jgi:hypothetical protein